MPASREGATADSQLGAGDSMVQAPADLVTQMSLDMRLWLEKVASIEQQAVPKPQHPNALQRRRTVDFSRKWRQPDTSVDAMHEFESFGKTLSEKTVRNIGAIAFQMSNLKKDKTVTRFAKAADGRFGLQRRSWAKFVRVCAHLPHVAYLSASDPDTFRGAVIGVRLALFPKLVEGDVLAGQQGKESAEVQLTRKFIKELLEDWGFNPRTGTFDSKKLRIRQERAGTRKQLHAFKQRLDDIEKQKKAQKEREDYILERDEVTRRAAEKQREYFLNGFGALSAGQ